MFHILNPAETTLMQRDGAPARSRGRIGGERFTRHRPPGGQPVPATAAGVGLLLSAMQNTWWVLLYGRRTGPG